VKISAFGNVYNSTNEIESNLELDKLGYSRINITRVRSKETTETEKIRVNFSKFKLLTISGLT